MDNSTTSDKLAFYNSRKLDGTKIWILFLLLGWSYGSMDSMGKQILYYLTAAGVGIWFLYRLFTLNKAIKKHNRTIALEVGLDQTEILKLGL